MYWKLRNCHKCHIIIFSTTWEQKANINSQNKFLNWPVWSSVNQTSRQHYYVCCSKVRLAMWSPALGVAESNFVVQFWKGNTNKCTRKKYHVNKQYTKCMSIKWAYNIQAHSFFYTKGYFFKYLCLVAFLVCMHSHCP